MLAGGAGCAPVGITIESVRIVSAFLSEPLRVDAVIVNDTGAPQGRLLVVELLKEQPTMERDLVLDARTEEIVELPTGRYETDVSLGLRPSDTTSTRRYAVRLSVEGEGSLLSPRVPLLAT